jgi:hypothetical protein
MDDLTGRRALIGLLSTSRIKVGAAEKQTSERPRSSQPLFPFGSWDREGIK